MQFAGLQSWTTPRHGVPPFPAPAEIRAPARSFALPSFATLAIAVLAVAELNLTYRLDREFITDWDESLYAISALQMLQSGDWISTTFNGRIDYYNAKPPLNVWLIAIAFKTFGVSATALRLPAVRGVWPRSLCSCCGLGGSIAVVW